MKRLTMIICLLLLVCLFSAPVSAQINGEAYAQLKNDAYQEAYHLLEEGIAGMAPVIYIPAELEIRYLDILDIARVVCLDHPEYFWFLESWFYEYDMEDGRYLIEQITPTYYLDHERVSAGSQALADAMIEFHEKVNEIVAGIPVNCTDDYQIALYLHDYLAEHVTYSLDGDHDSAYAALVHGKAACYGYSKAYQYLLTQAGVRSRIIVGDSKDENGELLGHAWNQVWIDGECYYTDVTWDDLEIGVTHRYFLTDLEDISKDHIAEDLFVLPECGHSLDFYSRSAGKGVAGLSETVSGIKAAEYFRLVSRTETEAVLTCDIRFDGDISAWLDRSAMDLINTLGLSYETAISYYYFDDVYYLILTDPAFRENGRKANTIRLNVTEISLNGPGAQAELDVRIMPVAAGVRLPTFVSDDTSVAVVDENGMVTAVGPGSALITVTSADGGLTAQCTVTVDSGNPHVHSLRLIGASDATCTLDGNDAYYLCTGCFHRFADEEASQAYMDVSGYARMATGHVDLIWTEKQNKNSHHQVCSCGVAIAQTTAPHKDADEDGACDLCNAEMTTKSHETPDAVEAENDYMTVVLIGGGVLAVALVIVLIIRRRYP